MIPEVSGEVCLPFFPKAWLRPINASIFINIAESIYSIKTRKKYLLRLLDPLNHGAFPTTSYAFHRHIGLCRTFYRRGAVKRFQCLRGRGKSELRL